MRVKREEGESQMEKGKHVINLRENHQKRSTRNGGKLNKIVCPKKGQRKIPLRGKLEKPDVPNSTGRSYLPPAGSVALKLVFFPLIPLLLHPCLAARDRQHEF
ncbi:hypothetical protein RUM44_003490 [Polyplax serrata]|uniref:Uncharacterized protein n=1 Tax=Polyplax serrata TaxID=468196 RepID=A0ABR1AGL6_POLSC